jgi:AcrR family transcriptional regulator
MTEDVVPRLTAKGQATRERIVAAAAALMFERGVAGTSTDEVQARAGVSASQLYHYFADKRALVAAVIAWQTEAVVGGQEPFFAELDSLEALRQWRDLVLALQTERACAGGCPLATLAGELAEADPQARNALRVAFNRWSAGIAGGLVRMRERGELRAEADPQRLAVAVLAALQGGLLLAQVERSPVPLAIALDTMLDHLASWTTREPAVQSLTGPGSATSRPGRAAWWPRGR